MEWEYAACYVYYLLSQLHKLQVVKLKNLVYT